jgi:hypothetical protein
MPSSSATVYAGRAPIVALCLSYALVLAACSAVPAGTIRGQLNTKAGKPSQDTGLQLLKAQEDGSSSFVTTSYKVKTDDKGGFSFENIPDGKYAIMVLDFSFRLGGSLPSPQELLIRDKDNKAILVELSGSKGVDLGTLEHGE